MISGPTGPVIIAIILLLGWIFAQNSILKISCGLLLLAWFTWMIWIALVIRSWIVLILPGLAVIAWGLLSFLKNTFAPEN